MSVSVSKSDEIAKFAKTILYAGAILGIIGAGLELWLLYQNNKK